MEILKALAYIYIGASVAFTTFFLVGLTRHLGKALKKEETAKMIEQVKNQIKLVYLERVGDVHYLYDKTTNSFIAQGNTEDEMWANAHLTFPKQEFIISGENGKAILVTVKDKQ